MKEIYEKFRPKYPKTVKYIEDNITSLRCNMCGRPILKETNVEGYPYQCMNCDENLYLFETTKTEGQFSDEEIKDLIEDTAAKLLLDDIR